MKRNWPGADNGDGTGEGDCDAEGAGGEGEICNVVLAPEGKVEGSEPLDADTSDFVSTTVGASAGLCRDTAAEASDVPSDEAIDEGSKEAREVTRKSREGKQVEAERWDAVKKVQERSKDKAAVSVRLLWFSSSQLMLSLSSRPPGGYTRILWRPWTGRHRLLNAKAWFGSLPSPPTPMAMSSMHSPLATASGRLLSSTQTSSPTELESRS